MTRPSLDAEIRAAQRAGRLPELPEPLTAEEAQLVEGVILALEDAQELDALDSYYSGWGKRPGSLACVEVWGCGEPKDANSLAAKLRQILPLLTRKAP